MPLVVGSGLPIKIPASVRAGKNLTADILGISTNNSMLNKIIIISFLIVAFACVWR